MNVGALVETPFLVATATQLGAFGPDPLLLARFDGAVPPPVGKPAMVPAAFINESVMSGDNAEAPGAIRYGLGFAKPDRWTSVVTTLALCLFFVVRRMV